MSFVCTHLNGLSYICLIDWTLTATTTLGQCRPEINGNEGLLHIPQSSRTVISPSDGLAIYIQNPHWGVVLPLCRDALSIYYTPSSVGWRDILNLQTLAYMLLLYGSECDPGC